MRNDWMPGTRAGQLAMAKRWQGILPGKETEWRIPDGMTAKLGELTAEAETLQNRADSAEGTKGQLPKNLRFLGLGVCA